MFSFLKASPPAEQKVEASRVDAEHRKLRWQVFAGVFIGYAAYYLIRKNFSLAMPYL
ncbi:glycerol-3-phosphate transporter, partial [Mannheimia haemolytica]